MRSNGPASNVIESPFLEAFAWDPGTGAAPTGRVESPFVNAYAETSHFEGVDPEAEEVRSALAELYDGELDEVLYELAHEAAGLAARGPPEGAGRLLQGWVEPLRAESEQLFENLAGAFARTPLAGLAEAEVDRLVDAAAQPGRPLEPVFEDFFKKLVKKARAVVKRVASVAKKGLALAQKLSPVHLLLGRLKSVVQPLIDKVLRLALDKLPAEVRPAASKLAQRLLGSAGLAAAAQPKQADAAPEGEAAAADVGLLQRELDEALVGLMFGGEDGARELLLHEAQAALEAEVDGGGQLEALEAGRARFAADVARGDAEGAGPAVEQFVPAILPALKLGVRLIGRPRVVSTLAGLVGKLIGRFVGPEAAPALSRALVDTGMRLLSLEAPEQETEAGPLALASTVEDVVRRVSEASDEVLDDSRLLEAEVLEAFHQAAAAHFPPALLAAEKRESATAGGAWVLFPRGGYKKYTRVFEVELTPDVARAVKAFGGTPLEAFLRDRLRVELPVRARVHLYEAVPGTWASRIVRAERGVPGLGGARKGAWQLLHPLTPEAAGALLREPGLGRAVPAAYGGSARRLAVGQRLFYLELPGAPTRPVARAGGVEVVADFPKNALRLSVYLAERQAQGVAQRLNGGASVGAVLASLKELLAGGVRTALAGGARGRVRVIHEAVDHEGFLGGALRAVSGPLRDRFADKVVDWAMKAAADHLQAQAASFVAAAQAPEDGVTLRIALQDPPGMPALRALLRGRGAGAAALGDVGALLKGAPAATVESVPGYAP